MAAAAAAEWQKMNAKDGDKDERACVRERGRERETEMQWRKDERRG